LVAGNSLQGKLGLPQLGRRPAIVAVLMLACEEREAGRGGTARLKTFLLRVPLLWLIAEHGTSWAAGHSLAAPLESVAPSFRH